MRSLLSEGQTIGLLLFDEPSAALDPTAEHGMDDGLLITFILIFGFHVRPLRTTEKPEREKNHDFLLSQVRPAHKARGPDSVRPKPSRRMFAHPILRYMNDSEIVEAGTHAELMLRGGEYAGLWNLQAQAFL